MSSIKNPLCFKVKYDEYSGEGAVDDLENLRRVRLIPASTVRKGMWIQGTFEQGHFLC